MVYIFQIDVTPILQRWGAVGVLVVAGGVFIWKWVLPRIDQWLEQRRQERAFEREERRKRDERFVEMISQNLEAERTESKEEREKFVAFVDGTLREQTATMATLIQKVDEKLK